MQLDQGHVPTVVMLSKFRSIVAMGAGSGSSQRRSNPPAWVDGSLQNRLHAQGPADRSALHFEALCGSAALDHAPHRGVDRQSRKVTNELLKVSLSWW